MGGTGGHKGEPCGAVIDIAALPAKGLPDAIFVGVLGCTPRASARLAKGKGFYRRRSRGIKMGAGFCLAKAGKPLGDLPVSYTHLTLPTIRLV